MEDKINQSNDAGDGSPPDEMEKATAGSEAPNEEDLKNSEPVVERTIGELVSDMSHQIQAGVGMMMAKSDPETLPKPLRTGINIVQSDHSALARLLIEKEVITEAEYIDGIISGYEKEIAHYEDRIRVAYGMDPNAKVTLV